MKKIMMTVGIALIGLTALKTNIHNNVAAANETRTRSSIFANVNKFFKVSNINPSDTATNRNDFASNLSFYKGVLRGIGANITAEKIKFLEAWRRGEGGHAKYNPFNTTKDVPGTADTKYNSAGVRNYPDEQTGLYATIATLKLHYYKDIVALLKKDNVKANEIAHCRALKKWGTGDNVKKVLAMGNINVPRNIA